MSSVFRVILQGSQETPPNNSTASGAGTVIFDSEAVAASYSFDIQGLDFGPATGGPPQTPATDDNVTRTHFHTQVAGVAGPIVFGQIDSNPALVQDTDDLKIVLNADRRQLLRRRPGRRGEHVQHGELDDRRMVGRLQRRPHHHRQHV